MPYTFPVMGDYRISSVFGPRSSPGGIGSTNHRGIDIAATAGTPVVSPISGEVIFAGSAGGYGNQVQVRGDDGYTHTFSHLQGFSVKRGMTLQSGMQVGAVGTTGNSTGPHLHYEVRDAAGKAINPKGILDGALKTGKDAIVKAGKDLLGIDGDIITSAANAVIPGSGTILEATGIIGDCDLLCQFQKWIKESGFFQRLALAILAFIIIAGALYLIKGGVISQVTNKVKGAVT